MHSRECNSHRWSLGQRACSWRQNLCRRGSSEEEAKCMLWWQPVFYAFEAEFKRSGITWLKAFEKHLEGWAWWKGCIVQRRLRYSGATLKGETLSYLVLCFLFCVTVTSALQPFPTAAKGGCEKRHGVDHSCPFESAVSECKKNIRKTVALVTSTLRQSAEQNLQRNPQYTHIGEYLVPLQDLLWTAKATSRYC